MSENKCKALGCDMCCRELSFRMRPKTYNEYFKGHEGVELLPNSEDSDMRVRIKKCPQLNSEGECDIYNLPEKPYACGKLSFGGERCRYLRETPIDNRKLS